MISASVFTILLEHPASRAANAHRGRDGFERRFGSGSSHLSLIQDLCGNQTSLARFF